MQPLRVAAVMEAYSVTGPAKNLLRFARNARLPQPGLPPVEIHIVTYVRGPGPHSNAFLEAAKSSGIPCHLVKESGAFDLSVLSRLPAILKEIQPDLVQTHSVKSHFLFRLAGLHRRYPWLAFHHGYTDENLKVRMYNRLDAWSLRKVRQLVTVCTPFAAELIARGVPRERIVVLPNSIEAAPPAVQQSTPPVPGLSPQEPLILHIGRFSGEKNHPGLLDAFDQLCSRLTHLAPHLALVGDGVHRERIEARVNASPYRDRIHLPGLQQDVWPYLRQATLFTLPSLSEGSPNVILEAMAAGLPIVSTHVGGIPDLVPHKEAALLVAPGDTNALSRALESLLLDAPLAAQLAETARGRVSQFSPEAYRTTLTRLYQSLLSMQATGKQ